MPWWSQLIGIQLTLIHWFYQRRYTETKKSEENQTTGYKNTLDTKVIHTKIRVATLFMVEKRRGHLEYPSIGKWLNKLCMLKMLFTFWKQELDLIYWSGETAMTYYGGKQSFRIMYWVWFQIGKGVRQDYILSPCLFNLYAEYIMRNTGLEEAQAGIKIARRNISNLRYADDTTLMAESEEELKASRWRWRRRVKKPA